jgi:hypothetical protein
MTATMKSVLRHLSDFIQVRPDLRRGDVAPRRSGCSEALSETSGTRRLVEKDGKIFNIGYR